MIRLEDVSKSFDGGRTFAVSGVDLSVAEGTLLVLLGESGSGKTTTLQMINRLVDPTAGRITVAGRDVLGLDPVSLRRRIGYVFQGVGLFPHMTVAENVATVPRLLGWPERETAARTEELLGMVGLDDGTYADRYPAELSGGQRQRVGVARALAARPEVLLMDEPFGKLDPVTRDELQDQFRQLQQALGVTVVLVTHDVMEALLLADRIAVMKDGELLGEGSPGAMLNSPPHEYIRTLMEMPKRQAERVEHMARPAP